MQCKFNNSTAGSPNSHKETETCECKRYWATGGRKWYGPVKKWGTQNSSGISLQNLWPWYYFLTGPYHFLAVV